jgi:hypothetical protein
MNFTFSELGWAASHDWFCDSDRSEITVVDMVVTPSGDTETKLRTFTDFQRLKDWVGY